MADRYFSSSLDSQPAATRAGPLAWVHLDLPLLIALMLLCGYGLLLLYSATDQDPGKLDAQMIRLGVAFVVMIAVAQIPPSGLRRWSLPLFGVGLAMLAVVLVMGATGKGAQRWLDLGLVRFQPSELLKLAVPMMLAWFWRRSTEVDLRAHADRNAG